MKKLILTSIALLAFTGFTFAKTVNQNSETENSDSKNQSITMTYTKDVVTETNENSDFGFWFCYKVSTEESFNPLNGETTITEYYHCRYIDLAQY